jgi:hypothetical protein
MNFTKVSEPQFRTFIERYDHKLTHNTLTICDPPHSEYHDFSGGKVWPESVVAYIVRNDATGDKNPVPNEYFIKDELAHSIGEEN